MTIITLSGKADSGPDAMWYRAPLAVILNEVVVILNNAKDLCFAGR